MKAWLLTNTPSPYQVEFLSAIHADSRCELSVRFLRDIHRGAAWEPADGQSFEYRVLRGLGPRTWSDAFRLHPSALREALSAPYDLFVLSGQYTSLTAVTCGILLSLRRKPWALWLEPPWPEDYRPAWTRSVAARSRIARVSRRALLRMLLRLTRRVFCIGTAALEAYSKLLAPRLPCTVPQALVQGRKLGVVPYCCDIARYENVDPRAIERARCDLGLHRKVTFLFSGQLIERKGVDVLLSAFNRLAAERDDVALIILGDGPLRSLLQAPGSRLHADRTHFAGHVPYADIPALFKSADIFVFPSRHDGWGVVVNEACAASLPVITTRAVGAARDLVVDGYNGFVLERDDVEGFYAKMKHLAENPAQARVMGERSHELVQKFSLPAGVDLFVENCRTALNG
jgi:glycosyltransferase involved in cell wall biosynthesis